MKLKYIFYTFNTLTDYHLKMAIESIKSQDMSYIEEKCFVIYNNSTVFNNNEILDAVSKLDIFSEYEIVKSLPKTKSTLVDIQAQLKIIDSADFYFLHKSDFFLSKDILSNALKLLCDTNNPLFVSFSKFDLREAIIGENVKSLSEKTFQEIMSLEGSTDLTSVLPPDWGVKYDKIGYRGPDGTMHCYNESARKLINMDTFCSIDTVIKNREAGVEWIFGREDLLALHMFHELPSGRNSEKDIVGFRF